MRSAAPASGSSGSGGWACPMCHSRNTGIASLCSTCGTSKHFQQPQSTSSSGAPAVVGHHQVGQGGGSIPRGGSLGGSQPQQPPSFSEFDPRGGGGSTDEPPAHQQQQAFSLSSLAGMVNKTANPTQSTAPATEYDHTGQPVESGDGGASTTGEVPNPFRRPPSVTTRGPAPVVQPQELINSGQQGGFGLIGGRQLTGAATSRPPVAPPSQQQPQQQDLTGSSGSAAAQEIGGGGSNNSKKQQNPAAVFSAQNLVPARSDGTYSEDQVKHLMSVIEAANSYGREIEDSVMELSELLRKKTIECDGLRSIANETYAPLRQAVKSEYEMRLTSERRHVNEVKKLQDRVDELMTEKSQLSDEVQSLRLVVGNLEKVPQPTNFDPQDNRLFNRLLRGDEVPTGMDNNSSWGVGTSSRAGGGGGGGAMENGALFPQQRELVNYLLSLSEDDARALQSCDAFDIMTVLCRRLCTPREGTGHSYPQMSVVLGDILRDVRNNVDLRPEAMLPIPLARPSMKQKCLDLYLANNPRGVAEITQLLNEYDGREDVLYSKLEKQFAVPQQQLSGSPLSSSQRTPAGTLPVNTLSAMTGSATGSSLLSSSSPVEMHARVVLMYKKYNPEKLRSKELNELLSKYAPEVLLSALVEKYGPEPTAAERRDLVKLICEDR